MDHFQVLSNRKLVKIFNRCDFPIIAREQIMQLGLFGQLIGYKNWFDKSKVFFSFITRKLFLHTKICSETFQSWYFLEQKWQANFEILQYYKSIKIYFIIYQQSPIFVLLTKSNFFSHLMQRCPYEAPKKCNSCYHLKQPNGCYICLVPTLHAIASG